MEKFVLATYLDEEGEYVDKKKINGILNETFKGKEKEVVLLDLSLINSNIVEKLIDKGSIDCFAFSTEKFKDVKSNEMMARVIGADKELGRNTKFLNIYNQKNKKSIEDSVSVGDVMLSDEVNANLTHIDISADSRILKQTLKGIKNEALKTRLKQQQHDVEITSLATSIVNRMEKEKDEYTSKHIRSVTVIAKAISEKMGINKEEFDVLKIGALLHDIGKEDIADEVLKKTTRLTNEEFMQMKQHVYLGEIELNEYNLGIYERAKVIAAQHHEKFDGTGYPRGLKGDQIDILSRIVSVADSAQAMFGRSYAEGKNKEQLIAELQRCSGTQFDPNAVNALVEVLEKEPQSINVNYGEDGKIQYVAPTTEELLREKHNLEKTREDRRKGVNFEEDR